MSGNSLNSIYRLNMILALFQAERACYTIGDIAGILDVPVSVVRKDIVMLHTHKECGITFFAKDEEDLDDIVSLLESGHGDDILLCASAIYRNEVYLPLSELEFSCLNEFLDGEQFEIGPIHKNYVIKPMYNQARANMQVKVEQLNQIIQDGETIRVTYKTRDGKMVFSIIQPLELVHNAMDDLYYVVTISRGSIVALRLDRIRNYEISEEKVEIKDKSALDQLPNIWGMEVGPKVHVKILIRNEANVQHKVKRDLASRVNGVWTQEGDQLYFEDDVIGMNSFRNWVNSYGSSILVIEPKDLREEIIESAKKRLEYYC
ncbi:MAG: WYL domain-containing protein [Lachnospiraceae bacterium]|nr:WYL domain-containing protein [Lachnospiraceae bacterium]